MAKVVEQKTRGTPEVQHGLPNAGELAALRAWFEGIDARDAVVRYLGHVKATGQLSSLIEFRTHCTEFRTEG